MFRGPGIKCQMLSSRPEYLTVMETGTIMEDDIVKFKERIKKLKEVKHG